MALTRGSASAFLPGFVVFPGGAVEPKDRALAERLFGDPAEAPRACALRELYEEAGLLLTADGPVSRSRWAALEDLPFDPPAPSALIEVARWVAPEALETRFDALFFATGAPRDLEPWPDGAEIDRAWWTRPADVLAAHGRGELSLMWPTEVTMRALTRCETVADVLALRMDQVPRPS